MSKVAEATGLNTAMPHAIVATDDIDEHVRSIARRHLAGELSESDARTEVAGTLYGTGILREVVANMNATVEEREDVEDRLTSLMTHKIVEANGERSFNFEIALTSSACGWYRRFAQTAKDSELRNVRMASRRTGTPFDHTSAESSMTAVILGDREQPTTPWSASSSLGLTADEEHAENRIAEVMDRLKLRARYLRGSKRTFVEAEALVQAFNLRRPLRPVNPADREFVLQALTEDPTVAYRSLRAHFDLLTGDAEIDDIDTDPRIMQLWHGQSADTASAMLERDADVAHRMAIVSASPNPRPSASELAAFEKCVMAINDDLDWKNLALDLCRSYAAGEFEPYSTYNEHRMTDSEIAEAKRAQAKHASRWNDLADAAIRFPGSPIGRKRDNVRRRLDNFAIGAGAIKTDLLAD